MPIVYCLFTCYFFPRQEARRGRRQLLVQSWSADQIPLVTPTSTGKSRCLYNLLKWSIFLLHQRLFARVFCVRDSLWSACKSNPALNNSQERRSDKRALMTATESRASTQWKIRRSDIRVPPSGPRSCSFG